MARPPLSAYHVVPRPGRRRAVLARWSELNEGFYAMRALKEPHLPGGDPAFCNAFTPLTP